MKNIPKNLVTTMSAARPVICEYASDITLKYVHFAHHKGPPPNPIAIPAGIMV